ncbi:Calreticulin family-domain-containing protein [Paraphysoderma sedebokerense]|nr:Calreticulin family-domain-containing protein [Paraphysoderma sedebokerense]
MKFSIVAILSLLATATAEVYFHETFSDGDKWSSRWVQSKHKDDYGKFVLSSGKFFADKKQAAGLKTSQDAKFYSLTAPFTKEFKNDKKKTLVLQFTAKNEQGIDCGGGYIKLLPPGVDVENFNGETPYNIMFGPDICGKVHAIFHYKDENKLTKKNINAPHDELTHLYQLVVKPDQTYSVKVDDQVEASGTLTDDWDFLPPKKIKDPEAKKPKDWDDRAMIPDPEDKKPEDYESIPELISDPDAKKPDDWDDEMDGEWEAPKIKNPEYKGEWKQKEIPNPKYKGAWTAPEIDNPEYKADPTLHVFQSAHVGFDLWQVKAGTIFDDILVTDDVEFANKEAEKILKRAEAEKKEKDKFDEAERKKAEEKRKQEEEERKKKEEAEKKNKEEEEETEEKEEKEEKKDESEEEEKEDVEEENQREEL